MKEIPYKSFSWRRHKKNWRLNKPNVCQFELTSGCALHCKHCYTDCYNKPDYLKKELNTEQIKLILDKVYLSGAIWLCFTGGDPLHREDFLDIYSYAKNKGFIITIFTNAYSMTKEKANYLKRKPPFVIEMTLNAARKETYEKISRVKGSFERARKGIDLILKAKLPLKIKTQITKDNLREMPQIKEFIERLGLRFRPAYDLFARLNGDLSPCNLRITPEEAFNLNGNRRLVDDQCLNSSPTAGRRAKDSLFHCAAGGGDGVQVDPYGNVFVCNLIRKPIVSLLKSDISDALNRLSALVRARTFATRSKCRGCNLRPNCKWCPGRAYVETGNMERPIEDYCNLAHLITS